MEGEKRARYGWWCVVGKGEYDQIIPYDALREVDVDDDPYDFVLSINVRRRHLTVEQKRDLIAKLLKAKPERSNRQIAKLTKSDHKTVAKVRAEKESTGDIPQLTKTVGADGRVRKSKHDRRAEYAIENGEASRHHSSGGSASSAHAVAVRLLVQMTAHGTKADPKKVAELLGHRLSGQRTRLPTGASRGLLDKLVDWLDCLLAELRAEIMEEAQC